MSWYTYENAFSLLDEYDGALLSSMCLHEHTKNASTKCVLRSKRRSTAKNKLPAVPGKEMKSACGHACLPSSTESIPIPSVICHKPMQCQCSHAADTNITLPQGALMIQLLDGIYPTPVACICILCSGLFLTSKSSKCSNCSRFKGFWCWLLFLLGSQFSSVLRNDASSLLKVFTSLICQARDKAGGVPAPHLNS